MYLEGLGFNTIGRLLKVSHVSVQNWIKKYGKKVEELKNNTAIEVVELDEMLSYIGSKKTISGFGLLLIGIGKDSSTSFWVKGTEARLKNYGKKQKEKL